MPDENDTTQTAPQQGGETTAASTVTQPSSEGSGKLFSQDEVNRIAAEAREQGRKSAHKGQPVLAVVPPAPAAQPSGQPPVGDDGGRVTLRQLQEQLDEEKMRRAFDKRATRRGLSDEQADDLFESFKAQRPSDADAWFDKKSLLYGFGKPGSGSSTPPAAPPAAPTTAAAPVQSTTPPISDKGAPSPGGVTAWQRELSENPLGMSPAAVTAMMSELGADAARKKIVEAGMRQAERIRLSVKASR